MARPTLTDSNSAELRNYPFMVSFDKCNGSCNNLDNPSRRFCLLNKTKNVHLKVFNIIIEINE